MIHERSFLLVNNTDKPLTVSSVKFTITERSHERWEKYTLTKSVIINNKDSIVITSCGGLFLINLPNVNILEILSEIDKFDMDDIAALTNAQLETAGCLFYLSDVCEIPIQNRSSCYDNLPGSRILCDLEKGKITELKSKLLKITFQKSK